MTRRKVMSGTKKDRSTGTNAALARGLSILHAFRQGEIYLGNNDLVQRTGIPKATISRMTNTLTKLSYLNYSPELGKYSISPGILAMAYSVFMSHSIHVIARPLMQRLADETHSTVGLGVSDGFNSLVYLEYARSRSAEAYDTAIGLRVPLGESAIGWAYLAALRTGDREVAIATLEKAAKKKDWPNMRKKIETGIREVWDRGFCISRGGLTPQANAVAVPFAEQQQFHTYGINCVGPAFVFTNERMTNEIGPRLLRMAEELRSGMPSHFFYQDKDKVSRS